MLLASAEEEQTLTITHVLWARFGLLPAGREQRPHRHQSVALDLILDARPAVRGRPARTGLAEESDLGAIERLFEGKNAA